MYINDNLATIPLSFRIYVRYHLLYNRITKRAYIGILEYISRKDGTDVLHNLARSSKPKSFSK